MTEAEERQAVVAEARNCIGTPYRHMGRMKGPGGGLDCAQLVWLVFYNCGLTPFLPLEPYPPDFMLHHGVERYLAIVVERARPVDDPRPGDVVLYRVGRLYAHGGIVVDPGWPHLVHAWAAARRVIADRGDTGPLARRPRKFFSRWSVLARAGLAGGGRREET